MKLGSFLVHPSVPRTRVLILIFTALIRCEAAPNDSSTQNPDPGVNTNYTLTATNDDGSNTRMVEVKVTVDPITEFFAANDSIAPPRTPYTLAVGNVRGSSSAQTQVTDIIPGEPVISEFSASNNGLLVDQDEDTSDWIEIHNPSASTAILNDYYLTDDPADLTKWRFPTMTLGELDYFIVFASGKDRAVAGSELHTSFRLRASGEYLALTKVADGEAIILSEFDPYPSQLDGVSYGLKSDAVTMAFFTNPTPGAANGVGVDDYVRDTRFAPDRGFYDTAFTVEITSATADAQIHYTTNGTDPTPSSGSLYTGPINISTTTTLKAIAFKPDQIPTNVDCHTYVFLDDVLQQPSKPPGFPRTRQIDYGMDPEVVNNPLYSDTIKDDLKAIPSIAIAMATDDLFGAQGLYANSNQSGVAWERPGSMELIFPDGSPGMQQNCGVRIQGGRSRESQFPKHSFRLLFKREYGDTKLRYPLFQDATHDAEGATDRFDSIILRAGFNHSWYQRRSGEENRAQYLRDQFIRDSQLAMGHASPHGTFVHLYCNGLYWGLYNVVERPNADFGASYYGGEKEEWDALNASSDNVIDGTASAWQTAQGIAVGGVADQTGYDALSQYVDIPNLIDYMLLNFYGGNQDWDHTNWYAIRRRLPGEGYKFICWDAERTFEDPEGNNRTNISQSDKPSRLYSQLRANPEFRLQFADHAHKHLFNGGNLTPAKTIPRYQVLADTIDRAIVGESARWGDFSRSDPYTRNVEWVRERDRLLNTHLPLRSSVTVSQLRGANLYPDTDAPSFSQHGGYVNSTTELTISSGSGTIYYTRDGSDPRLLGGEINPNATTYDSAASTTTLVPSGSVWKYLDDGSDQGTAWRVPGFDDTAWASGPAELGYGDHNEETQVESGLNSGDKFRAIYFRHTFNATNTDDYISLSLELQRDDGAIVYLNGNEVMRSNMPAEAVTFETQATTSVGGDNETILFRRPVAVSDLVEGGNTLAVEVHQISGSSSDMSFDLRLRGVRPNTVNPLFMAETGKLRARALDGGEWSALNEGFFFVDVDVASNQNLVISEIAYRPLGPSVAEKEAGFNAGSQFEFLELTNIGTVDIDLNNVRFTVGVTFNFSDSELGMILGAGERVLLVNNRAAFETRNPSVPAAQIAGEYSGNLNNDGEQIVLLAGDDSIICDMTYNDQLPWPESADGDGFTLVLIASESNPNHAEPFNWRASVAAGGSPGGSDAMLFTGANPSADIDGDQIPSWAEHARGTSDLEADDQAFLSANLEEIDLGKGDGPQDFLILNFRRNLAADDVIFVLEISNKLGIWRSGTGEIEFFDRTNNGDGTTTEVYRMAEPIGSGQKEFIRLTLIGR
ncbi:MAG TPA: hypothetical protein EYQ50_27285 [Verrucomicrobiales bacterium]|nr:hypothetical protein [Verrucomicrobiales bacterium]